MTLMDVNIPLICLKILRKYIDRIGLTIRLLIFDTSDQKTFNKECLKRFKS